MSPAPGPPEPRPRAGWGGALRSVRRSRAVAALGVAMVVLFVLVEVLLFRSYGQTERATQDLKTTTDATSAVTQIHRETLLMGQAVARLSPGASIAPLAAPASRIAVSALVP